MGYLEALSRQISGNGFAHFYFIFVFPGCFQVDQLRFIQLARNLLKKSLS
ncbi:hypothetical protein NSU_0359 [Novosphingobium pentaromativorans US6-1]|uniref:Uncharacterized protein n=1 Tax=Novosphingobium pentaromativorans US6-1 TaxID=1088721 RepID=G6E7M4_9SPHN|nr:hypothetical protein NSU_0359 [Novosphingobium pentaromativorans US6-1]